MMDPTEGKLIQGFHNTCLAEVEGSLQSCCVIWAQVLAQQTNGISLKAMEVHAAILTAFSTECLHNALHFALQPGLHLRS